MSHSEHEFCSFCGERMHSRVITPAFHRFDPETGKQKKQMYYFCKPKNLWAAIVEFIEDDHDEFWEEIEDAPEVKS